MLKKEKWFAAAAVAISIFAFYKVADQVKMMLDEEYRGAILQIDRSEFEDAIVTFDILGKDYQQSGKYILYSEARIAFEDGKYEEAAQKFESLDDFEDSQEYAAKARAEQRRVENEQKYNESCKYYLEGDYAKAYTGFSELQDFDDSGKFLGLSFAGWQMQCADTISAGIRCSVGIMEDGHVRLSTDDYFYGRDEIEHQWSDVVSVSACGEFVMGLKSDGDVLLAKMRRDDQYTYSVDTSSWHDVVDISAGQNFVAALKSDGTVYSAGQGGYGKEEIDSWENIVSIDTGWQHIVGLDQDGNVHVAGHGSEKLRYKIEENSDEWRNIIAIATGGSIGKNGRGAPHKGTGHIVAVRKDGKVIAVGGNEFGQRDVEQWSEKNIVSISAGDYHTVALTDEGEVLSTQREKEAPSSYRKVHDIWSTQKFTAISAGYGLTLVVDTDGSVDYAGNDGEGQAMVSTWRIKIK